MQKKFSTENIKELRSKTGAGITDCKKALESSDGNIDVALENLRKKGLAFAEKKAGRVATEGLVEAYVHSGSRLGVIVELNCETDFVARQSQFQQLAKDIAMQIAACQTVEYVSKDQIPEQIKQYEQKIELQREDISDKPLAIRNKIAEGRLEKRFKELCLMDQNFIKQSEITVEELVKQHIALLGENIKIRRFKRFVLGEGLASKDNDFSKEVSNMIAQK